MIVKPIENLSLYYAYSVSYLPASGDQFSSLTDGTVILAAAEIRQQRSRREVEYHAAAAVHRGGL